MKGKDYGYMMKVCKHLAESKNDRHLMDTKDYRYMTGLWRPKITENYYR